jgi:hypothetical protein
VKATPHGKQRPRTFLIPERYALRELRRALAPGGLPPRDRRTPEDHARIASFRAIADLLTLLDEYRRRIERGARCEMVEREHVREEGRFLVEIAIVEEHP